jgi:hypothetical protein
VSFYPWDIQVHQGEIIQRKLLERDRWFLIGMVNTYEVYQRLGKLGIIWLMKMFAT